MEHLRVGVVGAGGIAAAHLPAWRALGCEVVLWSRSGAGDLARAHGAREAASWDSLLTQVDVVDICTPTVTHRGYIEAAAAAGRHVLCEKPLARTAADAEAAWLACREAGVLLFGAHVVRYFPAYASLHERIGEVGTITAQRFTRTGSRPDQAWFHDEALSGGIILDQMIHDLDVACWTAGPALTALARQDLPDADGVTSATVELTHAGGATSQVVGTWAPPGTRFRTTATIVGTLGRLTHDSLTQALPDGEDGTGLLPATGDDDPFGRQITEMAAAFAGGPAPRVGVSDAIAAIRTAEAAIASLATGEPVSVHGR